MNLQETKPLGPGEEKSLNEKIRQLEDAVQGAEMEGYQGVNFEARDKKAAEAKLAEMKKIRDERTPQRAVGAEREALEKQEKILRERLKMGISWDKFMSLRRRDGLPYMKLVQQIVKWDSDPKRQKDIAQWKAHRRRLEPEDANFSSTMHLFDE